MNSLAGVASILLVLTVAASEGGRPQNGATVRVSATAPASGRNTHYQGNRAPLLPSPLIKLPIGAVRPEGWLRVQLERQAEGFSGRLEEISPWCRFDGSAWASATGKGQNGWEELPYWLKGQVDLGYVLGDRRVIQDSQRWIDAIIASQRPDGYFGPESNLSGPDLWPNMLALYALRSYYEATGDRRVIDLMKRYFRWQSELPRGRFLQDSWQKVRGGDNLDVVCWLYNKTGERWLLDLAKRNHEATSDWTGGVASWHGVNFAQGFREPAEYFEQSHDSRFLSATLHDYDQMIDTYGQVPGGMYGADENARPGYVGPRQGTETCSFVEMMYSAELLQAITGDSLWGDRCEEVAFNDLPAAMTPDLKGLHYLTCPNQVQLDRVSKSPMIQNGGDMFSYNPRDYRCCQHNVAFGWPYFAEHLWMATPGNGLAAALYAPCSVRATAGDGAAVTIDESTKYPFGDTVSLRVSPDRAARFPLTLRIPGWCAKPKLRVNGKALAVPNPARGWLIVDREWRAGDRVDLTLPMDVQVRTWKANKDSVSVYRGPLIYSLKIGEEWKRYGDDRWPGYEVFPTSPWNYGLDLGGPSRAAITVAERGGRMPDQPFASDSAPISLQVRGRRIPGWKLESNGLIGKMQQSPVKSESPEETLTLIPMGCARLRLTAFPTIGSGPNAHEWAASAVSVSASFVHDDLSALDDGILPKSPADQSVPRFTWWDHVGTTEWVQYDFAKPRKIAGSEVYWFDDERIGGHCRVPASCRILWKLGDSWEPVTAAEGYDAGADRISRVRFSPVETTALRLEARLRPDASAGILEWRVTSP